MVIGTTLLPSATPYKSPIFGRGGESAVFNIDMLNIEGSADMTVTVQHKNAEDTSWGTLGAFALIDAIGLATLEASGIKEMLRFLYAVGGSVGSGDFVHFFVYAPTWMD